MNGHAFVLFARLEALRQEISTNNGLAIRGRATPETCGRVEWEFDRVMRAAEKWERSQPGRER